MNGEYEKNSQWGYREVLILIGAATTAATSISGAVYNRLFLSFSPHGELAQSVKMTFLWGEKTICCKSLTIFYLEIAPRYDPRTDLLRDGGTGHCVTATIAQFY